MDIFDIKDISPMLIGRSAPAFDDPDYFYELKMDGERCLAYLDKDSTTLINKRRVRMLPKMPELANIHKQVGAKCILDGELIAGVGSKEDFEIIKNRSLIHNKMRIEYAAKQNPATFVAFDILYHGDAPTTFQPLHERKALLDDIVLDCDRLCVSRYVEEQGVQFFNLTVAQDLEGIVAKHRDSLYYPGKRTREWVKIKNLLDDDFVIAGYIHKDKNVVSLVIGQYDNNGDMIYKGHVALAISREDFSIIDKQPRASGSPFAQPPPKSNVKAIWLVPNLVCRVEFMRYTDSGGLRQPTYRGLRLDKTPKEAIIPDKYM